MFWSHALLTELFRVAAAHVLFRRRHRIGIANAFAFFPLELQPPTNHVTGRGGFNNYGGGGDEQADQIFVSGLPEDVNEDQLHDFFGSIGLIKVRECCGDLSLLLTTDC